MMASRCAILFVVVFFSLLCPAAKSQTPAERAQLPPNFVPTGKVMFKLYCAACHGADAKGHGPSAALLKVPPADLTTLTKRHGGEFPYAYVSSVLRFGPGPTVLHGTSDMPTWGPLFQYIDKNNETAAQQRIKNLSDYLASLQMK
jgi:mono/diheme cytochrome c family protein